MRCLHGDDVQQRERCHGNWQGEDTECEHLFVLSISGFGFKAAECSDAITLKLAFHVRGGTRDT